MTSRLPYRRRNPGFTLVEIVVVIGIVGVLCSILFPALAKARWEARRQQCTSQLRQLGQAMVMYDIDHDRIFENYPDRLTHLFALGYVANPRLFVCPMDITNATKGGPSNNTTLKPGNAKDDKNYWAEREWISSNGMKERNSSYLYEFSTRTCQSYMKNASGQFEWVGTGFGTDALVSWYDEAHVYGQAADPVTGTNEIVPLDTYFSYVWEEWYFNNSEDGGAYMIIPANPVQLDRDRNGIISWQEAKFWQLEHGDVYTTGYASPGEMYVPSTWSDEPWFNISTGDATMQVGYPRTWLPIVRCFWHVNPKNVDDDQPFAIEDVLNLAIDGNTFYSLPGWEQTAWKYGRVIHPDTTY